MKVYNIILRGFDQITVPRNVNRWPTSIEREKSCCSQLDSQQSSSSRLKFENVLQNGGDPDEAFLPREPCGEDRLPEGRRGRHQEAPLVPGFNILQPRNQFHTDAAQCWCKTLFWRTFYWHPSAFWPDNNLFRVNGLSRTLCWIEIVDAEDKIVQRLLVKRWQP